MNAHPLDGPATLAASTLLSIVLLHPDVHDPADVLAKAEAVLDATLAEMIARAASSRGQA